MSTTLVYNISYSQKQKREKGNKKLEKELSPSLLSLSWLSYGSSVRYRQSLPSYRVISCHGRAVQPPRAC